ncbi:MAG: aldehyde dehydrogenase family protein [Chitinivibrionales bacterium]|nr:aldehyde dehydrogenase family protein [Chitinivibrionales bacterium]MBD3395605.1 aldehyde dehydrogenase family protein [Chitinivibrionales bacterium]
MPPIAEILARQDAFFRTGKTLDISFRLRQLANLKACLARRKQELLAALAGDMHKPSYEACYSEIGLVQNEIGCALRMLRSWARPRRIQTPRALFPGRSKVYRCPYGVCLIFSAWNYPVQLTLSPLVGAVAAGNCAVVKPSERSTRSSAVVAALIRECFDERYVAAVEGEVDTAKELLKQNFNYVFFTGSTAVGSEVLKAAARLLVPSTLQLGGKCPCVVDRGADINIAAKRTVWGKFFNAGQSCVSPDYAAVPREDKDAFVKAAIRCIERLFGADPQKSPDYSRIIDRKHFDRLKHLCDTAAVAYGGRTDADDLYIAPTIIDNAGWDDPVMQEEIFGPVMPVLAYDDLWTLMAEIAAGPSPLSLYFFSKSKKRRRRVINEVPFGCGCMNDTLMHIVGPHLPFGGIGASGIGRYHGKASFDTFSYEKGILDTPLFPDIVLRYPPSSALKRWIGTKMFG